MLEARFIARIDDKCVTSALDILETIAQRFWNCIMEERAWDFNFGIINSMKAHSNWKGPWRAFDWYQEIFGKNICASLSKYS